MDRSGSEGSRCRPKNLARSEPEVLFAAALAALGLAAMTQGGWIFAKAQVAQILLDRAFNESVSTGRLVKPWSWADTWPIARIEIARLGVRTIVLDGASGQALAFGPGHVEGTPEPGDPGTAVYSAHRDTHFRFLAHVLVGDRIDVLLRDGRSATFEVTGSEVVAWDASGIDPSAAGRNLVLVTCWPLDARTAGPERLLVHARFLEPAVPTSRSGRA